MSGLRDLEFQARRWQLHCETRQTWQCSEASVCTWLSRSTLQCHHRLCTLERANAVQLEGIYMYLLGLSQQSHLTVRALHTEHDCSSHVCGMCPKPAAQAQMQHIYTQLCFLQFVCRLFVLHSSCYHAVALTCRAIQPSCHTTVVI